MARFRLNVNDAEVTVSANAGTPLLWVVRDALQLTGTKFGCGVGQCGACTVHLDQRPARSCLVPIERVGDRRVRTIEGLRSASLHPVQIAWLAEQVAQCGYCQSGQIMTAAALLARKGAPSDGDIDRAFSGMICRCGTAVRIRRAVHRAARSMNR